MAEDCTVCVFSSLENRFNSFLHHYCQLFDCEKLRHSRQTSHCLITMTLSNVAKRTLLCWTYGRVCVCCNCASECIRNKTKLLKMFLTCSSTSNSLCFTLPASFSGTVEIEHSQNNAPTIKGSPLSVTHTTNVVRRTIPDRQIKTEPAVSCVIQRGTIE